MELQAPLFLVRVFWGWLTGGLKRDLLGGLDFGFSGHVFLGGLSGRGGRDWGDCGDGKWDELRYEMRECSLRGSWYDKA